MLGNVQEIVMGRQYKIFNGTWTKDTPTTVPLEEQPPPSQMVKLIRDRWDTLYRHMYWTAPNEAWRFNLLYCFTSTIKYFDGWMYHEDAPRLCFRVLRELGEYWKRLLVHSNEELRIDPEFTRPGVLAMLEDLREAVDLVEREVHCLNDDSITDGYPLEFEYE